MDEPESAHQALGPVDTRRHETLTRDTPLSPAPSFLVALCLLQLRDSARGGHTLSHIHKHTHAHTHTHTHTHTHMQKMAEEVEMEVVIPKRCNSISVTVVAV